MGREHAAEQEEEVARETSEVEGEVFIFEARQAGIREVQRVVSILHDSICVDRSLTMLRSALPLLLTVLLPRLLTLPRLPTLTPRRPPLASRSQLNLEAYVIP
jgi:hypothetical protein